MSAVLTRRVALSGAVASVAMVGVAAAAAATMPIVTPAGASPAFRHLMQANDAAEQRFCAQRCDLEVSDPAAFEVEIERMLDASRNADAATPTNWGEFVELFEHMVDDGDSALSEMNADRLLAHARRLAMMGGAA